MAHQPKATTIFGCPVFLTVNLPSGNVLTIGDAFQLNRYGDYAIEVNLDRVLKLIHVDQLDYPPPGRKLAECIPFMDEDSKRRAKKLIDAWKALTPEDFEAFAEALK